MSPKEKTQEEKQRPLVDQSSTRPGNASATRLFPFFATRRDLINQFRSKKLVKELIAAGWIDLVLRGGPGRAALFDYPSAERAAERIRSGEMPQVQDAGGPRE